MANLARYRRTRAITLPSRTGRPVHFGSKKAGWLHFFESSNLAETSRWLKMAISRGASYHVQNFSLPTDQMRTTLS